MPNIYQVRADVPAGIRAQATAQPDNNKLRWYMNQPELLQGQEVTEILRTFVEQQTPAIMSHLSRGKWHMTKVLPTCLDGRGLCIEVVLTDKPRPVNIQIDQPVGISFKLGYNKFIFETVVTSLEPSASPDGAGRLILAVPDKMERIQRRNFFRVPVPPGLNIRVLFWYRGYTEEAGQAPAENYWQAKLLDLSAGGMQILVSQEKKTSFVVGHLLGLQFTPMPYEKPILLEGQVRHIAPTADQRDVALGLQIIGLEASVEGREKLRRLCGIVEQYHQMNQTAGAQHAVAPIA
jgi:hypothetical protein